MTTERFRVLHTFNFETKFSREFFRFLKRHRFPLQDHYLFHYGQDEPDYADFGLASYRFARHFHSVLKHLWLLRMMFRCDRIIIHNLASPWLLLYLYVFPSLAPKVFWVVWGKDLYYYHLLKEKRWYHEVYEFFRRRVFPRIKHLVTTRYDYEKLHAWYGVDAEYHVCFMYPSNLFKALPVPESAHSTMTVQVGNSADPSNNHEEIFSKLASLEDTDFKVLCPLAYGDRRYKENIIRLGKKMFGERFIAQESLIPYDDYLAQLAEIDVAFFNHNRSQAMGNIITLLGLGKKVYLRRNTSHWLFFRDHDIHLEDCSEDINLLPLPKDISAHNIAAIRTLFSESRMVEGLKIVLGVPSS